MTDKPAVVRRSLRYWKFWTIVFVLCASLNLFSLVTEGGWIYWLVTPLCLICAFLNANSYDFEKARQEAEKGKVADDVK